MKRLLDGYYQLLKILLTVLMGLIIIPVALQILSRYTELLPRYIWTEEAARFCLIWIIMIGSMIAVRDKAHFEVDLLPEAKTNMGKCLARLIPHLAMLAMAVVFVWDGYEFAVFGFAQQSEITGINMLAIYVSFPLAGATWILFLTEKLGQDLRLLRNSNEETRSS